MTTPDRKLEWASQRFKLNLSQNPLIASLMAELAIEEGRLADWEIEALGKEEIPELPRDREFRLSREA